MMDWEYKQLKIIKLESGVKSSRIKRHKKTYVSGDEQVKTLKWIKKRGKI